MYRTRFFAKRILAAGGLLYLLQEAVRSDIYSLRLDIIPNPILARKISCPNTNIKVRICIAVPISSCLALVCGDDVMLM
ncbi:MAG TPA: hypothetical protein PKA80_07795 [Ignavibacteriaceae bacterium]|nr:hypothetical protein [Ignavibacteriaceae bacterium]